MSEVRAAPIFLFAVIFRVLLHFSSADPNIFLLGSVITSEANIFLTELELQSERSDCECSFGPLRSNIVIRTACCSVGVALPVYSTFKAIETKDQNAQQRCLLYWGSLWVPYVLSPEVCISYLASTSIHQWSKTVICEPSAPFFARHQTRVDQVVGLAYSEVVFLVIHISKLQTEFVCVEQQTERRSIIQKLFNQTDRSRIVQVTSPLRPLIPSLIATIIPDQPQWCMASANKM
ncbi:hypothetical protein L6164_020011 [Bauhinia variegata]|uniref:Uncharacterized protein n=1 Tax=Bauhinia variegata TaxID=167791 RepID=A0ACB9MU10_BAUVA|nr:hypothetical protein L6164_020011 [Bauhinia variegata]